MTDFYVAVEGDIDEHVARRLLSLGGVGAVAVYGREGKARIRNSLNGYNQAAGRAPWFVLVDLDNDDDCVREFVESWLPQPANNMVFRVAVREVEAWLLADQERVAGFLGVSQALVPRDPEGLADPKQALVNLARRSRKRRVRESLVPSTASGRSQGPAYTSELIRFVTDLEDGWRPEVARARSESLDRCIRALGYLTPTHGLALFGGGSATPNERAGLRRSERSSPGRSVERSLAYPSAEWAR